MAVDLAIGAETGFVLDSFRLPRRSEKNEVGRVENVIPVQIAIREIRRIVRIGPPEELGSVVKTVVIAIRVERVRHDPIADRNGKRTGIIVEAANEVVDGKNKFSWCGPESRSMPRAFAKSI